MTHPMNGTTAAQRQVHSRCPRAATIGATTLGHRALPPMDPLEARIAAQGIGDAPPAFSKRIDLRRKEQPWLS
jgi:hypothetical protein